MTIYHLRISLSDENEAEGVVSNFCKKFDQYILQSIFAYEYKEDDKVKTNHHIHGHIVYDNTIYAESPNLNKIKYYLKSRHNAKHYHVPIKKDPENNELYVTKECRIIVTKGYSEERLNEIKQKNEAIEEDKKLDPKVKMIQRLKEKHGNLVKFTMNQLLEEIKTVYIMDWDKFPPPQCRSLCEYITVKEIELYKKKPRTKKNDFGDESIIWPPLSKSWDAHCEAQFRDYQCPGHLDWDDEVEETPQTTPSYCSYDNY